MAKKFDEGVEIRHNIRTLPALLKYGFADKGERESLLSKKWFKKSIENTGCNLRPEYKDRYKTYGLEKPYQRMFGYKALLQSEAEAIAETTLVQEEVYRTILEGTEPAICWRDILPTVNANSYRMRFVKGESGQYASEIAEGGAVEVDTQEYTSQNVDIVKLGTRPLITEELIQDALFDVIEHEIKKAGRKIENKLNRYVLNKTLNGTNAISTSTHNPTGAHIAVTDIARIVAKIKKQDYIPDTLVTHPTAEGYLLQDSNLAYLSYAGQGRSLTEGEIPRLMGLRPYTCTATDLATSPVWDDTTAGSDVTAIALSREDFGKLVIARDLTVKEYDDPIHDLRGIVITMRMGFDVNYEKSGGIIYHK